MTRAEAESAIQSLLPGMGGWAKMLRQPVLSSDGQSVVMPAECAVGIHEHEGPRIVQTPLGKGPDFATAFERARLKVDSWGAPRKRREKKKNPKLLPQTDMWGGDS